MSVRDSRSVLIWWWASILGLLSGPSVLSGAPIVVVLLSELKVEEMGNIGKGGQGEEGF